MTHTGERRLFRVALPVATGSIILLASWMFGTPLWNVAQAEFDTGGGHGRSTNILVAATRLEPQADQPSRLAVIRNAPEFKLIDQAAAPTRMSDFRGKVVLVSFIFTTCSGSCPATTHRVSLVQRELKSRGLLADSSIRLMSITLDPARDTPEVLRGYMQLYDADASHWSFLTGSAGEVERAIEAWGMWARPAANGQLDHPSRIFLVDKQGRVREIYNLSFMKPEWVVQDIELLLHESAR